jgi:hypothetical protein
MNYQELVTSKDSLLVVSSQALFWSGQAIQGHVNWLLGTIAAIIGLLGGFQVYINARKKGRVHDLEIRNLELENEKLEREKSFKINQN